MNRVWMILLLLLTPMLSAQDKEAKRKLYITRIDKIISYGLKKYRQRPNNRASDEVFARRVYLDIAGRIPTYNELQEFLTMRETNRRDVLIDKLLNSEAYVSSNFNYWADVLRPTVVQDALEPENYIEFIKDSIRKNKPYDKFVHEMITSKGEVYKPGNGATGYYMRDRGMPLDNMSNTMKIFLGTSMECAQCHDHPFDRWTQLDFYKLAAFTSETTTDTRLNRRDPRMKMHAGDVSKFKPDFAKAQVFGQVLRVKYSGINNSGTGMIKLPHDYDYDDAKPNQLIKAEVPFGPKAVPAYTKDSLKNFKPNIVGSIGPEINSRKTFADWVISKSNPMFTKVLVNRLWEKIMGAPLVGAVTDVSMKGKGANPYLTDELIKVMQAVNFDMKEFYRIIYRTEAYQRETSRLDLAPDKKYAFHGPLLKRLTAEQIWDSLLSLSLYNPDASLAKKNKLGPYDYLYSKLDRMKAPDMAKYVTDKNYSSRGTFMRDLRKLATEYNKSIISNNYKAPAKSKEQAQFDKVKSQLDKAKAARNRIQIKRLEKQLAALSKKIKNSGGAGSMGMGMMMSSNARTDDYARASELPSPAPRGHFLRRFGQSERQIIDGATREPSVPQAFTLLNGKVEDLLINNSKSYLRQVLDSAMNDQEKIEIAFKSILSRKPKYSEVNLFKALFKKNSKTAEKDLIWALVNSNEFIFKR